MQPVRTIQMFSIRKETQERLKQLRSIERGSSIHLTYPSRHKASRKALIGKRIIPPKELFVRLGGKADAFDDEALRECRRQLKAHGYTQDQAVVEFFGELEEVWIRTEEWPEEGCQESSVAVVDLDNWIERVFKP